MDKYNLRYMTRTTYWAKHKDMDITEAVEFETAEERRKFLEEQGATCWTWTTWTRTETTDLLEMF